MSRFKSYSAKLDKLGDALLKYGAGLWHTVCPATASGIVLVRPAYRKYSMRGLWFLSHAAQKAVIVKTRQKSKLQDLPGVTGRESERHSCHENHHTSDKAPVVMLLKQPPQASTGE
jgi:hypothetical protein